MDPGFWEGLVITDKFMDSFKKAENAFQNSGGLFQSQL